MTHAQGSIVTARQIENTVAKKMLLRAFVSPLRLDQIGTDCIKEDLAYERNAH